MTEQRPPMRETESDHLTSTAIFTSHFNRAPVLNSGHGRQSRRSCSQKDTNILHPATLWSLHTRTIWLKGNSQCEVSHDR